MKIINGIATITLIILPLTSLASVVTLESDWFLVSPGAPHSTLTFSYDNSIIDTNADPLRGTYLNALLSFEISANGITYILDETKDSEILTYGGPNIGAGPGNAYANGFLKGSDGSLMQMGLRIESAYKLPPTDSLNELPFLNLQIDGNYLDLYGASPGAPNWLWFIASSPGFTAVPLPGSIWLLFSAFIGTAGIARRHKTNSHK